MLYMPTDNIMLLFMYTVPYEYDVIGKFFDDPFLNKNKNFA